ncbi:PIN domain-containing protein [Pseudonocardia nematodicida]|uniref:PIN domain-containing protein n=1 Tax=Pseudonocardia nematodicida TaxID=1206997 RepID=A0ABV1KHJ7_9PSEU
MIVIDTNVVSEMMRARPEPAVLAWVDGAARLHTTAIAVAEVEYGIARLPDGHRKDRLAGRCPTGPSSLQVRRTRPGRRGRAPAMRAA